MSYGLLVADVRRNVFEERNFDLLGFCSLLGVDPYILLPEGDYAINPSHFKKIIKVGLQEEEFLNPLNMAHVVERAIQEFGNPYAVILSSSSSGMEIAPYVAGYFKVPIITDVSNYDGESKIFYKSYYSDKVLGHFKVEDGNFFVATVRSGSFKAHAKEKYEDVEYVTINVEKKTEKRSFLGYIEEERQEVDITKADFLISIGRGVGSKDEIPAYEELASLLKATLSASRPVIDKQWLPKERQVGTSGKTVKPKVYLAMGISGAFQHIAGMRDSECIIAVNKDPEAPIFQYAHYGIVGDMHKLRDKLREILKGS
jgi:electron transfer flavoprotein alpha subunit